MGELESSAALKCKGNEEKEYCYVRVTREAESVGNLQMSHTVLLVGLTLL